MLFLLSLFLLKIGVETLVLRGVLLEDAQRFAFPFYVIFVYLLTRKLKPRMPAYYILILALVFTVFSFRLPIMRELGYFEGRVIVGKFEEDSHGYEARRLVQSLKTLGRTYNLPGPSLLPITPKDILKDSWLNGKSIPSLAIFGDGGENLKVFFPLKTEHFSELEAVKARAESYPFPGNGNLWLNIKPYSKPFVLPYSPSSLIIPRSPDAVMEHYIAWLSAFFNETIASNPIARIDVVNEAARVGGPWKSQVPKAFARYLFSYQELVMGVDMMGSGEIQIAIDRLDRALSGLRFEKKGHLYSNIITLKALLILKQGEYEAHDKAIGLLKSLVDNQEIPLNIKISAAYNLSILYLNL